jgi:3-hydroxyisobutyrate dehydrogenase-like beta-hydroxyacid dehydrogenase
MSIGYIGLGAMGGALARRLMLTHKLRVYDLNPQRVQEFADGRDPDSITGRARSGVRAGAGLPADLQ